MKPVFIIPWLLIGLLSASACATVARADPLAGLPPAITEKPTVTLPPSLTPTPFQPMPPTATFVPPTKTPAPSHTPTPTATFTPTSTATWVYTAAGKVTVPILLYHHVADVTPANRYYVGVQAFDEQMALLQAWGYTTITPAKLVDVLLNGRELPARPIIITFDDGNMDVYENAFPIMQARGFVGAFYIVANRLESNGYLHAEHLQTLVAAGWEIGSHSMSHPDLTQNHDLVRNEILQSRLDLEEACGAAVTSFAYPLGMTDSYISTKVSEYGYTNGMGLGTASEHTFATLFYLSRREVQSEFSLTTFAAMLPWTDPLPSPTASPTPTVSTPSP